MKRVAILQSNYIPWKGYFDIIHDVDLFIFYDDVQYTKNDWRNRNKIKTPDGLKWLTIPAGSKLDRKIHEVPINDTKWASKHWKTIQQYYSKAPYFHEYNNFLEEVYLGYNWLNLSELNQYLIKNISKKILGIDTVFKDSREFNSNGQKQDRLLSLLSDSGAKHYISGPSAQSYIDNKAFQNNGIKLSYKNYSGYPEYSQFHPPFEHNVTILDLLFHTGSDAPYYIWGWRKV